MLKDKEWLNSALRSVYNFAVFAAASLVGVSAMLAALVKKRLFRH